MNWVLIFLSVFLVGISSSTYSQEETFIKEESLGIRAYYYDSFDGTLLPIGDISEEYPVVYFILDRENYVDKKVVFDSQVGLTLFLNGKMIQRYEESKTAELVFARLFDDDKVQLLAVYLEDGVDVSSFQVVSDLKNLFANKPSSEKYVLLPLHIENKSHVFIFLTCLLLVFAYLRFVNAQYLYAYFDLSKMFSRQGVEEYIYMNPFTGQSLLLMLACSLSFALGVVQQDLILADWMTERYVLKVLLIGGCIYISVLLKQLFLLFLNVIYGNVKLVRVHFFEYARMFALSSVLFCVLSFTSFAILKWGMIVLFASWLIWMAFILVNKSGYRKMYLFSYLCGSEIFPILVMLKLLEGL